MKVLLRRNVRKLGVIGEVVEVKPGYARNYLVPQGLAMAPNRANLKQVDAEKKAYLQELARLRAQIEARAKLMDGKEFTITARANEEGHLYGSVGPAQVAAIMAQEGHIVSAEDVRLDEPIHKLDKVEVTIELEEGITAKVTILVVPPADSEFQYPPPGEQAAQPAEATGDDEAKPQSEPAEE